MSAPVITVQEVNAAGNATATSTTSCTFNTVNSGNDPTKDTDGNVPYKKFRIYNNYEQQENISTLLSPNLTLSCTSPSSPPSDINKYVKFRFNNATTDTELSLNTPYAIKSDNNVAELSGSGTNSTDENKKSTTIAIGATPPTDAAAGTYTFKLSISGQYT